MRRTVSIATTVVALASLVALSGCANSGSESATIQATPIASSTAVAVTVYGQAIPPNAPGQMMTLYAVEIPVGASIAPHQHPGQQLARITAGELTYTVDRGTMTVFEGTGKPGEAVPSRSVTGPSTVTLGPGTTISEQAGMIHNAKNLGTEPVKIELSILVPQGDPLSVPAK